MTPALLSSNSTDTIGKVDNLRCVRTALLDLPDQASVAVLVVASSLAAVLEAVVDLPLVEDMVVASVDEVALEEASVVAVLALVLLPDPVVTMLLVHPIPRTHSLTLPRPEESLATSSMCAM